VVLVADEKGLLLRYIQATMHFDTGLYSSDRSSRSYSLQ